MASVSSLITISSLLTAKNGEWMNTLAVGTTFGVNYRFIEDKLLIYADSVHISKLYSEKE